CDATGINMAIHPDDPPWDMFGLPRIITGAESYDKMIEAVPDKHNGFTFCIGSLGAERSNDLPAIAEKYAERIYFAHIRQLKYALVKGGFDGYVRPDHGRNIWGEDGKPGYGLYDRALGACYLNGLFEAIEKE
ncbi:MAG: mannonate dehydratase, partial [Clostridia bacterium]|nr:mannonate dehydratase [Clostridia bacterium]